MQKSRFNSKNSLKIKSIHLPELGQQVPQIPLAENLISAGFPSPAEGFMQKALDLNELIIKHPAATFFVRVIGNSMEKSGIYSNDILVVDRALSVSNNKVVVARLNDEFLVKRICLKKDKIFLLADNDEYLPIEITKEMDFEVWGVVTHNIHNL
jgi:DNA polymerase V